MSEHMLMGIGMMLAANIVFGQFAKDQLFAVIVLDFQPT